MNPYLLIYGGLKVKSAIPDSRMQDQDDMIIEILKQDSRTPFMRIASKLGVSEGTIRNRVRNLQKKGMIKKFTIETGNQACAIIMINVRTGVSMNHITEKLKEMGVLRIFEVAGKTDIVCFVKTKGLGETNKFVDDIRTIEGVVSTETMPVLKKIE